MPLGFVDLFEIGVVCHALDAFLKSAVFCNAKTIDAAAASPDGMIIPLVRVNPHPGTVE